MSSNYQRSLSSDFGGHLSPTQLQKEINQSENIDPTCIVVTSRNGDNVNIKFDEALTSQEETELDSIIASHLPSSLNSRFFKVYPTSNKTNHSTYYTMATTTYAGSNNIGSIDQIDIVSNMDPNLTSYQIRIIDHDSGNTIASQSELTNINLERINLGSISNIPTESTLLEIQMKKTGNNNQYAHLKEIIIYHGN